MILTQFWKSSSSIRFCGGPLIRNFSNALHPLQDTHRHRTVHTDGGVTCVHYERIERNSRRRLKSGAPSTDNTGQQPATITLTHPGRIYGSAHLKRVSAAPTLRDRDSNRQSSEGIAESSMIGGKLVLELYLAVNAPRLRKGRKIKLLSSLNFAAGPGQRPLSRFMVRSVIFSDLEEMTVRNLSLRPTDLQDQASGVTASRNA